MNVNLILLKAEIQKEIRNIAQQEEAYREQLSNLQKVVTFLEKNQEIGDKCRVGPDGTPVSSPDSNGDLRSQNRNSGIQVCPRCEVKVLPTKDGRCPSCQTEFAVSESAF
jgi:hypothetical protein